MLQEWAVVALAFAYLGVLFGVAYWADKRADAGRSVIASTAPFGRASHSAARRTERSAAKRASSSRLGLCGAPPGLTARQITVRAARAVWSRCSPICCRKTASNTAVSVARSAAAAGRQAPARDSSSRPTAT